MDKEINNNINNKITQSIKEYISFLKYEKGLSANSINSYMQDIEHTLCPFAAGLPLDRRTEL